MVLHQSPPSQHCLAFEARHGPEFSSHALVCGGTGQGPVPVRASSSSSTEEMVAGTAMTSILDDSEAHQELLRVAQNLGIAVEDISETSMLWLLQAQPKWPFH